MPRLVISVAARDDVRDIVQYLEDHAGPRTALRYAVDFDAALNRIAEMPGTGSPRQYLGVGVRMVMVAPYLMFYEIVSSGDVHVLRVLH
jgi:plasmid stabilization system protein ParE